MSALETLLEPRGKERRAGFDLDASFPVDFQLSDGTQVEFLYFYLLYSFTPKSFAIILLAMGSV